ncbi:MAG: MerR family transcriptional regulator [Rhodothermales bacterium]|nr:MerR family transcriptional regulator [Rhodothermales bacterium]
MKTNGIEKLYYSIGEVSELMGLEPHVLRYWESEFKALSPKKNRAGRRIYRKSDIKTLERIRYLLKDRKYTIEGARKSLQEGGDDSASVPREELLQIRAFLEHVLNSLD